MVFLPDDKKVLIVRKALRLNQSQLAHQLKVSAALVSAIERSKKKLTDAVMNKFVENLGVSRDWIFDFEGGCFAEQTPNAKKLNEAAVNALEELAQPLAAPLSVASTAIGISTSEVIQRLCKAYSAKNLKDLATNHLHISPTAISGWIKRNKIPDEQILKAIGERRITPEQLLSNDEYVLVKRLHLCEIILKMYTFDFSSRRQTIDVIERELKSLLKEYQTPLKLDEDD